MVSFLYCSSNHFRPVDFHCRAHDELVNCKQTRQVSDYINKIKCSTQKLPNITDDEPFDQFVKGLHPSILKEVRIKEDPKNFEKECHFFQKCSCLDVLT